MVFTSLLQFDFREFSEKPLISYLIHRYFIITPFPKINPYI